MLSVKKIFFTALLVGLMSGIGWMSLLNGILGHADLQRGMLAFVILNGGGSYCFSIIYKRLMNIWNLSISFPGKPSTEEGVLYNAEYARKNRNYGEKDLGSHWK